MVSPDIDLKDFSAGKSTEMERAGGLERRLKGPSRPGDCEMAHLVPALTIFCLAIYVTVSNNRSDFAAAYERGLDLSSKQGAAWAMQSSPAGDNSTMNGAKEMVAESEQQGPSAGQGRPNTTAPRGAEPNKASKGNASRGTQDSGAENQEHPSPSAENGKVNKERSLSEVRLSIGDLQMGTGKSHDPSEEAEMRRVRRSKGEGARPQGSQEALCVGVTRGQWPGVRGLAELDALQRERHASRGLAAGPDQLGQCHCALVGRHASSAWEGVAAAIDSHDVVVRLGRESGEGTSLGWKTTMQLLLTAQPGAEAGTGSLVQTVLRRGQLRPSGGEGEAMRLLISKSLLAHPGHIAAFEGVGGKLQPAPQDPDREVLSVGAPFLQAAAKVLTDFRTRLQCAFEDGAPLPASAPLQQAPAPPHEWTLLYLLLRACGGGVTAYGLLPGETLLGDPRLPRDSAWWQGRLQGSNGTAVVTQVLVEALAQQGSLQLCDADAAQGCGCGVGGGGHTGGGSTPSL